jgi:hypothetical protein
VLRVNTSITTKRLMSSNILEWTGAVRGTRLEIEEMMNGTLSITGGGPFICSRKAIATILLY